MPRTGLTPEEMRGKALDVALRLMREQGYEKVRLSGVARVIGVSHAALYAHFEDKEALLDGVTQRWLNEINAKSAEVLTRDGPAEVRLREWFRVRYDEKRRLARSDPEPWRAYDFATAARKGLAARHLADAKAQLMVLVREAGLGGEPEAAILLDAMQAFTHPTLIAAQAEVDRTEDLGRLLGLMIAGLENGRRA